MNYQLTIIHNIHYDRKNLLNKAILMKKNLDCLKRTMVTGKDRKGGHRLLRLHRNRTGWPAVYCGIKLKIIRKQFLIGTV